MYKLKSENENEKFKWSNLGDISLGRENLGENMPVEVYRLFQFMIRNILTKDYGVEKTNELLRRSGELAGKEFCKNFLDKSADFDGFIAQLQKILKNLKMGILKIEKSDMDKMEIYLIIEEDLECSGLPITNESVCDYDEGFIAGLLNEYTSKKFSAHEIDCWATGARVCRFKVNLCE